MSDSDNPKPSLPPPPPDSDLSTGRRRLLQGGLGAAPVLMTLVSRPVLAQGRTALCTSPSGFVSLNASNAGRNVSCLGRSPTFWAGGSQSRNMWPFPSQNMTPQPNTPFNTVFASYQPYADKSLLDVVKFPAGSAAPDSVARDIVASYLNALANLTPPLSPVVVKDIWAEFILTGFFSPSSGGHWNAAEIIDYLSTTYFS
jgi:hypothetical protein